MQFTIDPEYLEEFEYIVRLHQKRGAPRTIESVQDLLIIVMREIAEGSRCPNTYRRSVLEAMGLVADGPEHQVHREEYGAPKTIAPRAQEP